MLYEVCGKRETLGHAPGEKFEADLDAVTEARLVAGQHIRRVTAAAPQFGGSSSSSSTPTPVPGAQLLNDPDQA